MRSDSRLGRVQRLGISHPWRDELEDAIGPVMGWVIPIFLAYIPGLVIGFMIFTLLITRYQELPLEPPRGDWPEGEWPPVTILVAAWNESGAIVRTLERIAELSYAGRVEVVVADNNSTDDTALLADAAAARLGLRLPTCFRGEAGQAPRTERGPCDRDDAARRHGRCRHPSAAAVADATRGSPDERTAGPARLRVRRRARRREPAGDLRHPDAAVGLPARDQRRQADAGGVQHRARRAGGFSAYWTSDLRAVGGWPDAIGEDIVLTWTMLGSRGIVQYEPVALGFTVVPERLGDLLSQRSRWARGMLEGLRTHPPPRQPRVLAKLVAGIDYLVPFLDIGVIFFWVPGVILFLFGYPLIFGWWSMLLLPITLAIFGFMQRWHARHVFRTLDIHPQPDKRGFLGYLFAYQVLTSAAALRGYGQYIVGSSRRWR